VARVVAFIPDLLFGSNVVGALAAAGHDVQLVSALQDERQLADADVLIVDLTADARARIAAIPAVRPPALAFYSHVEQDVRELAEGAGLELVVPRSRLAREGAALLQRIL
jgi:nucleoside-diphosphate-sugar epimerase